MKEFEGKTAVVTGAASGIGKALAEKFAQEKMQVVLADIEEEALEKTVEGLRKYQHRVIGVKTDVLVEESEYQKFFAKALKKSGKSIPQMSDEEKKAFFNKIEKSWKGKGEKSEAYDKDGNYTTDVTDVQTKTADVDVNEAPRPPKMKKSKEVENIVKTMAIVPGLQKGGMASRYGNDFLKAKRRALKAINDMLTYAKIGV